MSEVFSRFRGALGSHFKTWSVGWDVGWSLVAAYLIYRNLPHLRAYSSPEGQVALYLSLTALGLASLISYRRANSLRSDSSWVNLREEKHHSALLAGEVLACLCLVALFMLPPTLLLAFKASSLLAPSGLWLANLLLSCLLLALASIAVFYLLSAFVIGAEGSSVFAWVIVIVGFSRSDVAREVARGLSVFPFLPSEPIGNFCGAVSRIGSPPLEELIKSGMSGGGAGQVLIILQAVLQSAFALCLSAYLVNRWGPWNYAERRQRRQAEAAEADPSGMGAA